MGFFTINREIEGEIEYFRLQNWWLNDLTKKEQSVILSIYKPLGMGDQSLIKRKIYSTTQTAIGFLSGLSSWFQKPEYRNIRI
ncbi:MAG: hypothetical protein P9M11_00610 [Candidatus Tenebribacter burtonii]|jgi:hypothetical protein|nr:hypothetical protein [Candidatus Tenebribacter burtonii]